MTIPRTTVLLVGAAAAVVVLAGVRATQDIVAPVMLALLLTILFHPLRRGLERRLPRWAASTCLLVAAVLLLVSLALAVVVAIGRLATLVPSYASDVDELGDDLGSALESMGVGAEQTDAMAKALDPQRVVDLVTSVLGSVLSLTSGLVLIVTLLVFFSFDAARTGALADGARVHRPLLVDSLDNFARGTRSYFGVSAVFGLIVAVIDAAVLYAMGIPGAFIWGVLAFVTNFIPNIGFVIGVIPPAFIGLLEGGPSLMLAVIVLYSVINVVIQSFIQPRFVGDAVGLSTSLTFLSLVFWTWVLGPLGALLAVPMSLLVRSLLVEADPDGRWRLPLISGQPDTVRLDDDGEREAELRDTP
ncbi:AI-2E family transporter [Nocardioides sp. T5]|uniref:AI-2E family transporter n=1 Tax=Nocardioides sp. T5 TaxID=3400182 RepID=UPI003A8C66B3